MNPARLVLPALRARDGTFAHEASAIEDALALGVGGFIIFGGTAEGVAELTASLQRQTPYRLLFAADLERGAGQQFAGLTVFPPPRALAHIGDAEVIRTAASTTAREARSIGLNWIFAPVADIDVEPRNPIVQTRAFGDDPRRVANAVSEWIAACQVAGALACVKHFPGHGRTVHDSHASLPTVAVDRETLGADLMPFAAAIAAGVASVMTAHVSYPALDPSGLPATRSPKILSLLREELGFDGAVVTDALMMAGATAGISEAAAATEVIRAGVDLLLYPRDIAGVVSALRSDVEQDPRFTELVARSVRRRDALVARIPDAYESPDPGPAQLDAAAIATRLMDLGLLRGQPPTLRAPLEIVVIDDDVDGDWPASPNTFVTEALSNAGVVLGTGGSKVVLAFCEARAGKGRGGFGPRTAQLLEQHQDAGLLVLFGHARLVTALPGNTPVLCAWHRQALMQRAAAGQLKRWLA